MSMPMVPNCPGIHQLTMAVNPLTNTLLSVWTRLRDDGLMPVRLTDHKQVSRSMVSSPDINTSSESELLTG